MTIIQKYHKNFVALVEGYNKKKKVNPYVVYTEEEINQFFAFMNRLVEVDVLVYDRLFHAHLIQTIGGVYSIVKKRKYKEKEFALYLEGIKYLKHWLADREDLIKQAEKEQVSFLTLGDDIVKNQLAHYAVNKYINLLASKTVDYIPTTTSGKLILQIRDGFVDFREMLTELIEGGLPLWVYCFTENYHYTPINLTFMNGVNKLGDKITDWIDDNAESKISELFATKGIECFSGWGNLSNELVLKEGHKAVPKPVKEKRERHYTKLSDKVLNDLIRRVILYTAVYL